MLIRRRIPSAGVLAGILTLSLWQALTVADVPTGDVVGGACGDWVSCTSSTDQPCSDRSGNYCSCNGLDGSGSGLCQGPQSCPCLNGDCGNGHCHCSGIDTDSCT